MLVILTDEQILSPKQVCQGCLLASHSGLPRWDNGKLGCGQSVDHHKHQNAPPQYECQMGFRLANVD
ncbi:MAG: hypothetical protein SW833_10445 [Cyanobacteriota bacterium]|nr:hypothetical protein [Cyanobacteriota bacterium]